MSHIDIPLMVDLHGLTVQQGYNKTFMFVRLHRMYKSSHCKVVTGRSGKMKREFTGWMKNPQFAPMVESYKEFDDRGSFILKLKNG